MSIFTYSLYYFSHYFPTLKCIHMTTSCRQCGAPNPTTARSCYECGQSIYNSGLTTGDVLILAFVGIQFFAFFVEFFFNTFLKDWYSDSTLRFVRGMVWAGSNLAIILPAATIQNKNLRVITMVIAGLVGIYYGYLNLKFAF